MHPECECRQVGFNVGEGRGGVVEGFGAEVNLGVVKTLNVMKLIISQEILTWFQ